jgi:hypothetical protein
MTISVDEVDEQIHAPEHLECHVFFCVGNWPVRIFVQVSSNGI